MINNGSTDNTEEVYKEFCEKHPEISTTYVFVTPNQGPVHGWKEGLKHAKGEYVMFHDADDWMEPNCLEKLAIRAKETNADRVVGCFRNVDNSGQIVCDRYFPPTISDLPVAMLQSMCFRRKIIADNEFVLPDDSFGAPYDFWIVAHYATLENRSAVVYGQAIYNYFYNPKSMVAGSLSENDYLQIIEKWHDPLFTCVSSALNISSSQKCRDKIEYLVIWNYYSALLAQFSHLPVSDAKEFYALLEQRICAVLPEYRKNPYLKPFHNGYFQPMAFACWMLSVLEKFHLAKLFLPLTKLIRFRIRH